MVYHCLIDNEKAAKNCLIIIQEYQQVQLISYSNHNKIEILYTRQL